MNPYGSYRALLGNSKSATLAAIEIYNKPKFEYRTECFVILILNSWELLFKAILSKNRTKIFKPKEKGKPYFTLKLFEAMDAAAKFFPPGIPSRAIIENISRLVDYRNNAVHFYNESGLEAVIYGLSQTSIVNYRDLTEKIFDIDIANEVNICLLPLSFSTPPDPIAFLGRTTHQKPEIAQFLSVISDTTKYLEAENIDTGRFLTVFSVHLQSTKKIQSADIVVGINAEQPNGLLLVSKKQDPNKSHPLTRKTVVAQIGNELRKIKFTKYTFDAIIWCHKMKEKDSMCWKNEITNTFQYSNQLITYLQKLTEEQITEAIQSYKKHKSSQPTSAPAS